MGPRNLFKPIRCITFTSISFSSTSCIMPGYGNRSYYTTHHWPTWDSSVFMHLLILQYIVKLKANIDKPAFDCVFNPQYEDLYDKNKKCIKSIGFRIQKHIDDSNIFLDIIKPKREFTCQDLSFDGTPFQYAFVGSSTFIHRHKLNQPFIRLRDSHV